MTEEPGKAPVVTTPAIEAAVTAVYEQGFEAGHIKGYQEGIRAGLDALQKMLEDSIHDGKLSPRTPIEDLKWTVRTYNCFKREGFHTLGDVLKLSEQDLIDIRNFGARSIDEVKATLAELGYALRGDVLNPS